jgi:eukaryotic-like serine/threonine-protein kinase
LVAGADCTDEETMALFAAGTLSKARRSAVEAHFDSCAECRRAIAALVAARSGRTRSFLEHTAVHVRDDPTLSRAIAIQPGDRIGRYVISRALGAGGMGVVYAARDPELDREVAIKLVHPRLWRDATDDARELLRQEARAMARVVDAHVVAVHDIGTVDDQLFVAMELVGGGSLDAWLGARPRWWREIIDVCRDAGRGLVAVHEAGLVHRDVKPSNVIIDDAGRARIADFGLAVLEHGDRHIAGTPPYMSPEQHAGGAIGPASDQFSFCVMVYEALYGERPFAGTAVDEIAANKAAGRIQRPGTKTRVPAKIRAVLLRGLQVDPDRRFSSMAALVDNLAPPKRRWIAITGAAVAALGSIVLTLTLSRDHSDPCVAGAARFAATTSPAVTVTSDVQARIDERARAWRSVHVATCGAASERSAAVAMCLEARRVELAAILEDLRAGAIRAPPDVEQFISEWVRDPAACRNPIPALLEPIAPRDPVLRARVTQLRYRLLALLSQNEVAGRALVERVRATIRETEVLGFEPLVADAHFVLGRVATAVDHAVAAAAFKRAASAGEQTNNRAAAIAWLELASFADVDGTLDVSLELTDKARAASMRIGHPADLQVKIGHARGVTLVSHGDIAAGIRELEAALAIASRDAHDEINRTTLALASAYAYQGREREAVAIYRRALASEIARRGPDHRFTLALRTRLAFALSVTGDHDAAIAEATAAVRIAEHALPEANLDRGAILSTLAETYYAAGRWPEALATIERAERVIIAIAGKRSELYSDLLQTKASVLSALERNREAASVFEEACNMVAFRSGEKSVESAACVLQGIEIVYRLGDAAKARAQILTAIQIVADAHGDDSLLVARAYIDLGECSLLLRDPARAAKEFNDARERLDGKPGEAEQGQLGFAEWGLARTSSDAAEAQRLVERALERWGDKPWYAPERTRATAWLAKHRKR